MVDEGRHSSQKISEALQLLEEAAKEKKEDIAKLISDRYGGVKELFSTGEEQVSAAVRRARTYASEKASYGEEKVREYSKALDEEVHRNPWHYIGGAALGGLLLGFILGKKS
jgi:ElaB/YqjD/DUF883 family membrane-anchored ribosome-binding protein